MIVRIRYFKPKEYECRCGCGKADLSEKLLLLLDRIREAIDRPLTITSGLRCRDHALEVKKKRWKMQGHALTKTDLIGMKKKVITNSHVRGLAVDIRVDNSRLRQSLISAALDVGVTRLGIGDGFIHLDIDERKVTHVIWTYYPEI